MNAAVCQTSGIGGMAGAALWLALAVACVVAVTGPAADVHASFPINGAQVSCDRDGSVTVVTGETVLVSGTRMVIAAPGWSSLVSQGHLKPDGELPQREGEALVWRGTIPDAKQNVEWAFEQRLEPADEGVRLSYAVTPSAEVQLGEACVFIDLPGATWQGKSILLLPAAAGSFPVRRGGSRHFLSGTASSCVLGEQAEGQMYFDFRRFVLSTVQDVRTDSRDLFQLYPRIAHGCKLEAGREYRLDITLVPNDHRRHGLPIIKVASEGVPTIESAHLDSDSVSRFSSLELTCGVMGAWENPFDPERVALDAEVTDPAGQTVTVPGFYWQDFEQVDDGGAALVPRGAPAWKVRYTPVQPGRYRVAPVLRNGGQVIRHEPLSFTCTDEVAGHGFVRVSDTNPHYFEYSDGSAYFALGENIPLIHGDGLPATFDCYRKLADAGGNLVRSWWCYSTTDLGSWQTGREGEGFGMIKLADAWRIDQLVAEAERLGLHIMCCLETQQNLRRDKTWPRFTYNEVNGGPLTRPQEFFTNPEAKAAFRNRLRYIVARWGYSPTIFSWQFWNEVNACNGFAVEPVAEWHREMAEYLRSIDPWGHLIHTNFGNLDGFRQMDGASEMQVVSSNIYSRRDMGQTA